MKKARLRGPGIGVALAQIGVETGAGGSGTPPGPAAKVSGETGACWPTPGLLQSHTPPGNTACRRACCAGGEHDAAVVGEAQRLELALQDVLGQRAAGHLARRRVRHQPRVGIASRLSVTGVRKSASPVR